jgi:hypothetical protein
MYTKKIDNVSVCYCCCALTPACHQAVFALLSLLRGAATDHTVQHGSCSLRLYEQKFDGNGTYELSSADTAATEDDIKKKKKCSDFQMGLPPFFARLCAQRIH